MASALNYESTVPASMPLTSSQPDLNQIRKEINMLAVDMNEKQQNMEKVKRKSRKQTDLQVILKYNRKWRKLQKKWMAIQQEHSTKVQQLMEIRQHQAFQQKTQRPSDVLLSDEYYPQLKSASAKI